VSSTAQKASPLSAIRHLDYVILLCDDSAKMRAFYHDVMGFPVHRDGWDGNWIEFKVGSVLLVLRPRGWLTLNGKNDDGTKATGSASVQLAFRVAPSQVDECHERLLDQGVTILDPPTDQPWKHRTVFFRDPEGNLLEIYADQ
jgi:catechol 2,3-dioxygenase-like lactoylglutathione lyase family enzyme